eukprot:scaffold36873_cov78-Phaeocystis_antarctica.AAC.17
MYCPGVAAPPLPGATSSTCTPLKRTRAPDASVSRSAVARDLCLALLLTHEPTDTGRVRGDEGGDRGDEAGHADLRVHLGVQRVVCALGGAERGGYGARAAHPLKHFELRHRVGAAHEQQRWRIGRQRTQRRVSHLRRSHLREWVAERHLRLDARPDARIERRDRLAIVAGGAPQQMHCDARAHATAHEDDLAIAVLVRLGHGCRMRRR